MKPISLGRMARWLSACLLSIIAFALVGVSSAHAVTPTVTPQPFHLTTHPNSNVRWTIVLKQVKSCRIAGAVPHLRIATAGRQRLVLQFRVTAQASGQYSVSLNCYGVKTLHLPVSVVTDRHRGEPSMAKSLTERIVARTITAPKSASKPTATHPISTTTTSTNPTATSPTPVPVPTSTAASFGPVPVPVIGPTIPADIASQAQAWWQSVQGQFLSGFDNGECTQLAETDRPDIVADVMIYDEEMILMNLAPAGSWQTDWDAQYWDDNAASAGLAVTTTPTVGAIAVQQPGADGAGSAGHVSYVEQVYANGSFEVSEMHAPTLGVVTERTVTAAEAAESSYRFIPETS